MKFDYNFPYPFLNLNTYYKDLIRTEKDDDFFTFQIGDLNIPELKHLSVADFIFGLEVNCSDTLFRKFYEIKNSQKIQIPLKFLRKKIEYDFIAIVIKDIEQFDLRNDGKTCYLEEGSCFATLRNFTDIIDFENSLSGLVKVIRDENNPYLSYDSNLDYLVINLPSKDFANYEMLMNDTKLIPFLHTTLVKPCLMDACYKIVKNPENYDSLWAAVLKNFAEDDDSYDEGFPAEDEIPGFIEKFLQNCTSTTIEFFSNGLHAEEEEPEYGLS